MKLSIFPLFLLAASFCCKPQSRMQSDEQSYKFIQRFLKAESDINKTVVLAATIDTFTLQQLRDKLAAGHFSIKRTLSGNNETVTETFTLSKNEQRIIDSVSATPVSFTWSGQIAPNTIILTTDTLQAIRERNRCVDCHLQERYGSRNLYTISKPVFLRENTICIFYFSYTCGSLCGQGTLAIFRKLNGKWENWISLYDWIS